MHKGLLPSLLQRPLAILCALLSFLTSEVRAQECLGTYTLTSSPLPVNGTYRCGQLVTFCLTVGSWQSSNTNWFHGIAPTFGPGWDLSTLTPGPPPATAGPSDGTWGWYAVVRGTSSVNVGPVGPGFFFDLDNDGNPGNNYGDDSDTGSWQFCFSIRVRSGTDCVNGIDLTVAVDTYGDSETGAWMTPGCRNDEVPRIPLSALVCPDPGISHALALCMSDPPMDLFPALGGDAGGEWTAPDGTPSTGVIDPASATSGAYTYSFPGIDCAGATVDVSLFPIPSVDMVLGPHEGCVPFDVPFTLNTTSDIAAANWAFGDGTFSTQLQDVVHTYTSGGTFIPSVEVTDVNGCHTAAAPNDTVHAYPPPDAAFHYTPFPLHTLFSTAATFEAEQDGPVSYAWSIAGQAFTDRSVPFAFSETIAATYPVCLSVLDTAGCTAQVCEDVMVYESFNVNVPNAFTPNGDGVNDVFAPVVLGVNEHSLSLDIFDRYGLLVYSSSGKPGAWNGSKDNAGPTLPLGIYVWRLVVQDVLSAQRKELIGHVALLK
ncbi:MAG: gliding motility-associated C-terminal domain-containing protein [Flavobacteriales bacterium]